ncbi:MFS transporter [Actinopolymorpha sp. B9G3]|uniref:MFS transporter n=1 Tax=Actinopolymorpha sp. B9G3 TaxID=3158970 RepID=UPI0032D8D402
MPGTSATSHLPVTRLYPLTVLFAADGVLFASWVVRVPEIKEQVGASATALGLALLCMTFSTAVSMYVGGRLCVRLGTRALIVATFPLACGALILPALARSPVHLGAVLLAFGAIYGVLVVALNSAAVEVERATGRAIMSALHGLWSLGGLVGAVAGGLLANRLDTLGHLGAVAAGGLLVVAVTGRRMLRSAAADPNREATTAHAAGAVPALGAAEPTPVSTGRPAAQRAGLRTVVILFGIVALCTAYGEGAVGDWAALHLRDTLATPAGIAAYGFGAYSVAIAVGRLTGGWLIAWFGEAQVLIGGAVLAAAGILATAWAGGLAVAFGGLVMVGLGLANMYPIAMARAGAIGGSRGVGLASTIGNVGMLGGPPVIGFLADQIGLPGALSTVAVLAMVAAGLGFGLRTHAAGPRARRTHGRSPDQPDLATLG